MDEQKKPEITEIAIVDERSIRDKIYVVRGVKVMLDFELAEIYGYTTSRFNEQVSNNIEKFEGDDFCFYLTQEEFKELKNLISKKSTSSWGGRRKPPRAFTESGLYMLMTVLRGDLATQQSRALIRVFRAMKDFIVETQGLVTQRDLLRLSIQTAENTDAIKNMSLMLADQQKMITNQQQLLLEHDDKLVDAFERINETVKQSDLSPVMMKFDLTEETNREFLLRDGHPAKADATYIDIYSKATKTVYIIDNYINIKTLRLLQDVKPGVAVTVFSDNLRNNLHQSDKADFQVEFPNIPIDFITTGGIMHDRFIVLDYNTAEERFYHCGASSKDAAIKLTTAIMEITSQDMKAQMHVLIDQMKGNPQLLLR
jgi:phosphopantetheine adenylyltransferase